MSMEKRGVIDENTPQEEPCEVKGEPTTKEAADKMQSHIVNDLIDEVAARTNINRIV